MRRSAGHQYTKYWHGVLKLCNYAPSEIIESTLRLAATAGASTAAGSAPATTPQALRVERGVIVMEDLSGHAAVQDFQRGLSLAQAVSVAKQLAVLHASTWHVEADPESHVRECLPPICRDDFLAHLQTWVASSMQVRLALRGDRVTCTPSDVVPT